MEQIALTTTIALAFFNAYILFWLGTMAFLSAENNNLGLRAIGLLLVGGACYFIMLVFLVHDWMYVSLKNYHDPFWFAAHLLSVLAPIGFYSAMRWFIRDRWQQQSHRRYLGFAICLTLMVTVMVLLSQGWGRVNYTLRDVFSSQPNQLNRLKMVHHFYSILCYGFAWYLLYKSHATQKAKSKQQISLLRMKPWLQAFSLIQMFGSITMLVLLMSVPRFSTSYAEALSILFFAILHTITIILLGHAIVAYEAFSEHILGRKIFQQYWRNTLIFGSSLSVIVGMLLVWYANALIVILVLVVTIAMYHTWNSWQMIEVDDLLLQAPKPSLTDATSDTSLLQNEFNTLCRDYLNAQKAILLPTGAATPFLQDIISYPDEVTIPALPSIESSIYSLHQSIYVTNDTAYPWMLLLWSRRGLLGLMYLSQRVDGQLYTAEECQIAQRRMIDLMESIISVKITNHLMALQRTRLKETRVMDLQTRRRLHDEVLPSLHMAILGLHAAQPSADDEVLQEAIDELGSLHQQISELIRTVPQYKPDNQQDLLPTLRQMLQTEFSSVFTACELVTDLPSVYVPPMILEVINGAIYEGLRNAAIHGRGDEPQRALKVTVQVQYVDDLVIEVIDDGVGLQAQSLQEGGSHHGLTLHNTLMAVIGGTITLSASDAGGTKLKISIARHAIKQHSAREVPQR